MSLKSVQSIFQTLTRQFPVMERRINEAEALARWDQAVGPLIAKQTKVVRLKEGVLCIEVAHPVWKTELLHRKSQILEKLNAIEALLSAKTDLTAKETGPNTPASPSASVAAGINPLVTDLYFIDPYSRPLRPRPSFGTFAKSSSAGTKGTPPKPR